jgi:tetratricopeptide (TPR) repeat protein
MSHSFKQAKFVAALLALVVAASVLADESPANKPQVKKPPKPKVAVSISKETTYITEPLRKDGSVNYIAALNERTRQGVTLENNSAVLFWQAVGPAEIWEEIRDEYFKMLGIPTLPEKGDYFVDIEAFLAHRKNSEKNGTAKPEEEAQVDVYEILDPAMKRPWSKQEFPVIAQWIEVNEKPMSLIVEASKRPRRYDPLVGGESTIMITVPSLATGCFRHTCNLLVVRAMLRLNEGKVDEAWDDLLTCHRLARLLGQGPTTIEALVASAIEEIACAGDLSLLQNTHLTAAQATKMREDLNKLPPMPNIGEKIGIAERFTYLDNVSEYSRQGLPGLAGLSSINSYKYLRRTINLLVYYGKETPADWDVSLRMGNAWYDRTAEAFKTPTHSQQRESLRKITEELCNLEKTVADANTVEKSILDNRRKGISEGLGQILIVIFGPELSITCIQVDERSTMRFELDKLAFMLAAYRADHGTYPVKLGDLVPKYIAELPKDICNDSELHYKQEPDGFLLYSVGNNGRDDGTKSYEDRNQTEETEELVKKGEDWDDLVVRIPAPRAANLNPAAAKEPSKKYSADDLIMLDSLEKKIRQSVKELDYSDETAQDVARWTMSWKDYKEDKSLILVLNQKINQAQKDCEKQKLTKADLARIEENIVEKLDEGFMLIRTSDTSHFSLDEIVKDKKSNCLGHTQFVYVLGNAIGLSVKPIWVEEMFDYSVTPGQLHSANLVSLSDNKILLVDFAFGYISEPFIFDEQYKQVGNYWEFKNKRNILELHPKIQILDRKGLVSCIYFNRGGNNFASGKYDQAIADYTKAIELNPKFNTAYYDRGVIHYKKAFDLDGKSGLAYLLQGGSFAKSTYLYQAIADLSKGIELNPNYAFAYFERGCANISIGNKEEAKKDLTKAVELDASLKDKAMELSEKYELGL